jgi:hypothetical protein
MSGPVKERNKARLSKEKLSLSPCRKHWLSDISFDEAFGRSPAWVKTLQDGLKGRIARELGIIQDGVRSVAMRDGGGYDLVLSPKALQGLKTKTLKLETDQATQLLDPMVKHPNNQYFERGKLAKRTGAQAARAAIACAHVVADLDTQAKLQEIADKLDGLLRFVRSDRIGELRAAYNDLQSLFDGPAPSDDDLKRMKERLEDLASRFYQTAKDEFLAIEDPSGIGWTEALLSFQSSAVKKLRTGLGGALADTQGWAFARFLLRLVMAERENTETCLALQRRIAEEARLLLPLGAEKFGYLDETAKSLLLHESRSYMGDKWSVWAEEVYVIERAE